MSESNTTNSIQLSAISNLSEHPISYELPAGYPLDGKTTAHNNLLNLGNDIYLEASIKNGNTYTSKQISLDSLITAIANYIKYRDDWNENSSDGGYLKVNGETRTWRPSSDVTIQPTSGKPFLVKNNSDDTSIEITNAGKIELKKNTGGSISIEKSSTNYNINIIATNIKNDASKTIEILGNKVDLRAEKEPNPVLYITSGKNGVTTNYPIYITNHTNSGIVPVSVKNHSIEYGEVQCTATKAKWA